MTEASFTGKSRAVESDYFIQRFGFDIELTPAQTSLYFTMPDYHRHLLETITQDSGSFRPEAFKYYLGLICGEAEQGGFKDTDKLAQRLWADYLDIRQEVTPCMELYRLSRLMFPLIGFDNLQPALESSIIDMVEQGTLPQRGDSGLMTVVCLPEFERNLCFMDDVFRGLPQVWRGYLDDKACSLLQTSKKADPEDIKTVQLKHTELASPAPPPSINPKAKPPEQRERILQEIQHREWNPKAVPEGGVKQLNFWFMDAFGKSEGVFRDRWQELRRAGKVETIGNKLKKSDTPESHKNN